MKKIIPKLIYILWPFFSIIFKLKFKLIKLNKNVVFVDIDNTIADSWPLLLKTSILSSDFHRDLPLLEKVWSAISEKIDNESSIIFISARPWTTYNHSYRWLRKNCSQQLNDRTNLILTKTAYDKLYYIKKTMENNHSILYFDDLSYGHELGKTQFYTDLIFEISELDITYYGYEFIMERKDV